MNQVFSFKRWLLLLKRHWTENGKLFFYGTLSLLGAISVTLLIWIASNHHYNQYDLLIFYLIGLYLVGAIFASNSFNMLQKKDQGIYYLSLPASHFEKLLTQIFFNVFFFTLVYSICFYGVQALTTLIIESKVSAHPDLYSFRPMDWKHPDELMRALPFFIYIFFGVQALFILGSVYFKRFTFLLTTIVLVILIFCIANYVNSLSHALFKDFYWTGGDSVSTRGVVNDRNIHNKIYKLPANLSFVLKWLMLLGWAPLLWLAACFRLKEKEI